MQYFVSSNLNHDGKEFKRGDTVELSDQAASQLLAAGVVQSESIELAAPASSPDTAPVRASDDATVGGRAMKTGEPSVDGSEATSDADTAKEVGPMAPTEPAAPEAPVKEPQTPAPSRNFFGQVKPAAPEPVKDPSAEL
ncbi:MAG: hypothetical protein AAB403_03740 [Planctomycetota bacterium]